MWAAWARRVSASRMTASDMSCSHMGESFRDRLTRCVWLVLQWLVAAHGRIPRQTGAPQATGSARPQHGVTIQTVCSPGTQMSPMIDASAELWSTTRQRHCGRAAVAFEENRNHHGLPPFVVRHPFAASVGPQVIFRAHFGAECFSGISTRLVGFQKWLRMSGASEENHEHHSRYHHRAVRRDRHC